MNADPTAARVAQALAGNGRGSGQGRAAFEALLNRAQPSAEGAAEGEGPEAPKLEEVLVSLLLKESKALGDGGDARTPLASQALVDHLIGSGAFDLGLRVEP